MKGFGTGQFDRRQYPRLDFAIPMAFHTETNAAAATTNASLGGMMAYFPQPVEKGQVLAVNMLLPLRGGKRSFQADAEVIWAQSGQFESGWTCQVGLKFLGMSSEALDLWRQFLLEWRGQKEND